MSNLVERSSSNIITRTTKMDKLACPKLKWTSLLVLNQLGSSLLLLNYFKLLQFSVSKYKAKGLKIP